MANKNSGPDPKQLREAYDFYKDLAIASGDFNTNTKETLSELKKVATTVEKIRAAYGLVEKSALDIKKIEKDINDLNIKRSITQSRLSDIDKDIVQSAKKKMVQEVDLLKKIEQTSKLKLQYGTSEYTKQQALLSTYYAQLDNLNSRIDAGEAEALALQKIQASLEEQVNVNGILKKYADEAQATRDKELRVSDKIAGKLKDRLGIMSNYYTELNKQIDEVINGERKATDINRWKILKTSIKESLNDPLVQAGLIMKANSAIFSGIGKAFSFIKDIAQKVFGLITGWNDRIFEFGKNLGVGEQDARNMMNHFQSMALNSGPLFLNMTGISKAFSDMSESLGFIAPMNDEMLQTATLLQRQFGLTATDLEAINANSALSGKSFKDTFDTINAIRMVEGGRNKVMMSQKQMMGEISKVSATVLMNFKGNVPALAEAVVRAKKLGLALNDVQGTTDQFLDFEGSISKEFEAQLFSGEDLNLQQIRRLALVHDTKGMMEEIGKRIPTLDKWNEKNTFDQEATAAAMGLTADKVSEIIQKQQIVNKLGVQGAESGSEMFLALKKQNLSYDQIVDKMKEAGAQQYLTSAITDKIGTFIDNIKMTLGQMLEGELGKTINGFLSMASNSQVLHGWLKKIEGVLKGVGTFFSNLPENLRLMLSGFAKIAGIIAALEGAIGLLLLVKSYGLDPRGWALVGGATQLGAAAYAANEGSNALGEMISVSKAAVQNEAAGTSTPTSAPATAANTTAPQSQVLHVYSTVMVEGDVLGRTSVKHSEGGNYDNNGGLYGKPYNNSNSKK